MAITKSALKTSIHSFLNNIANQIATSALKGVPLVGNLDLPIGQTVFSPLTAAIDSAIDGAGLDATDLVNALNDVPGITASMDGNDIAIRVSANQTLSLADEALDTGAAAAGIGLALGGKFATSLSAVLDAKLKVDGTSGDLWIVDPGNTKELSLQLQSDISVNAAGDLGFLDVSVADKDPSVPEVKLAATFDLAAGKAANAFTTPLKANFTGTAGLDLAINAQVANGLLPSIGAELVMNYDLTTLKPTIAFKDVTLDIGSFLGIFDGVFDKIYDILDSFPLGIILDATTGPLPIIDDFARKLGLTSRLDLVPLIKDKKISLSDLAVLYDSVTGSGIGKFFEGLSTIDMIRDIAQSLAVGKLNVGDFTVSDDPTKSLDSFLGTLPDQLKSDLDKVLKDAGVTDGFTKKGGLNIPLLDDPSLVVELLLNKVFKDPVTIVTFDLPDLTFGAHPTLDFPILGPLALTLEGDVDVGIDIGIGYDTKAILDATSLDDIDFADGLFFTNFDNAGQPSGDAVAFMNSRIGAGVALNAVVLRASATGGISFNTSAFLSDPDLDHRTRLAEITGCFFDPLEGKLSADVRVRLKIGFGPFSYTKTIPIASVVLADFSLGCTSPTSPVDHGLATLGVSGTLSLNTGPMAPNRILNNVAGNDSEDIEGYQIAYAVDPTTKAIIPGALAISAFGVTQSFGTAAAGALVISGDLGQLDDSLIVSANVTQSVQVHGGAGQDMIVGGAGADKLYGDDDIDYLVGNGGDDLLDGGAGDDTLVGGAGSDTLIGGSGIDEVSFADSLVGVRLLKVTGVDGIVGFGGDAEGDRLSSIEHLTGSNFNDTLTAEDSAGHVLEGLGGNDQLIGGSTDDFLLGGAGGDLLQGNGGRDGTSYLTSSGAVVIDMNRGIYYGGDATGDWLQSVEDVYGSGFADTLIGNGANNYLSGFFGDDTLEGGGGADTLEGDLGSDKIYALGDGDTLNGDTKDGDTRELSDTDLLSYRRRTSGGIDANLLTGKAGSDTIAKARYFDAGTNTFVAWTNFSSFENLEGTDLGFSADTLTGDDYDNIIWGLAGNDTINGGGGFDHLIGGFGADTMNGGDGIDWAEYQDSAAGVTVYLDGTAGSGGTALGDRLSTIENLLGSDATDTLYGNAGDNVIDPGLTGVERYYDYVDGGAGTDVLRLDYSRGDYGQGFSGGYFSGSSTSGYGERRDKSGNVVQDAVSFANVEALWFTGTRLADTMLGGSGADILIGRGGGDTIYAGTGSDVVDAGSGADTVFYGTGLDRQLAAGVGLANFRLDGGSGIDTLSLSLSAVADDIVLSGSTAQFVGVNLALSNGATISNFEVLKDVWSGSGDDRITQLGKVDNYFRTGDGADTIRSGLGFDTVDGGSDTTGLTYDAASGTYVFTNDDSTAAYRSPGDMLILDYSSLTDASVKAYSYGKNSTALSYLGYKYNALSNAGVYSTLAVADGSTVTNSTSFTEIERIDATGSRFDDVLAGTRSDAADAGTTNPYTRGDDVLRGLAGNDVLLGYGGDDILDGGEGNDELQGSYLASNASPIQSDYDEYADLEIDQLTGGKGADIFVLGTNRQTAYRDKFGINAYADITDFKASENDVLRVFGTVGTYTSSTHDGVTDILTANTGDLIARLRGVTSFDLSASYVQYLNAPTVAAATTQSRSTLAPETAAATAAPSATAAAVAPPAAAPAAAAVAAVAGSWVTQNADPAALLAKLGAGTGVVAGSQSLTIEGSGEGFGTFDADPFGLGSGIVLSTGNVEDLAGPNTINKPTGPTSTTIKLSFVKVGRSGNTDIFRADLSNLGIDINSVSFADLDTRTGGSPGYVSGFDIDSMAFSRTKLTSVGAADDLNSASILPKLDVFDFNQANLFFHPGTQRPAGGQPNLYHSINSYPGSGSAMIDNPHQILDQFTSSSDENGYFSLGDGGSLGVNLKQSVSSDGPLYLYIGDGGITGESIGGEITVSTDKIGSSGDLSTDLGAPGLEGDTSRMTYTFTPVAGTDLVTFQVVLFSEELPEHAGILDPDAVTVTLNGVSIAALSDGASADLNTLMSNPYYANHPDLILNAPVTGPLASKVTADAYTKTLTFVGRVQAGAANTLVVEAADKRDAYLDTGILIKGGTFLASGGALATNAAPFAVADLVSVAANTAVSGNVLTNDVDPNGDVLKAVLGTGPLNGTVSLAANGAFTYTPKTGFFGTDTFTYKANDGKTNSADGVVTLVVGRPSGVVADTDGSYAASEDNLLSVDASSGVLVGDSTSLAGATLSAQIVTTTKNGTLSLKADGSFTYKPKANFAGQDSFVYRASDGTSTSGNVTVVIDVSPINDAPVLAAASPSAKLVESGVAVDGTIVAGTTTATIQLTKTDPDAGDVVSFDATGWKAAGAGKLSKAGTYGSVVLDTATGVLTYTLDNARAATNALAGGSTATDSFAVGVTDVAGAITMRTVGFAVGGTNDAPVLTVAKQSLTLVESGVAASGAAVLGTSVATIAVAKTDPDTGDVVSFNTTGWTAAGGTLFTKAGTYGSVVLNTASGILTYTLDNTRPATQALAANISVTESFSLAAKDKAGVSAATTVSFKIAGSNDAPAMVIGAQSRPVVEAGTGVAGTPTATIAVTRSDAEGSATTFGTAGWTAAGTGKLSRNGVYGSVVLDTTTGVLTYTLDNARGVTNDLETGDSRTDSFSVTVTDAAGNSVTKFANFAITGSGDGVTINGSSGNDVVSATSTVSGQPVPTKYADQILGNNGDDQLAGLGGKDVIDGGAGVDTADYAEKTVAVAVTLNGATAATVTVGGVAEDTVKNIENLIGGSAGDTFIGDALANTFSGRAGKDVLDGGAGVDTADYAEKTTAVVVTLNGATVATVTVGGVAEDTVRNIENLIGGSAGDTFTGDAFANTFSGRAGKDILDGGAGVDTADYAEKTTAVAVTLNGATVATVTVGGVAEDTVKNIENIIGGSAGDTLTGDALANGLSGGGGNDVLKGGGGKDVLDGGIGIDTADYAEKTAAVVVTLNGASDATITVGGVAEDTIRNMENLIGGSAADTFTGDALANTFSGRAGKDVLDGGAGVDTADYAEKAAAVAVTLNGATAATVTVGGVAEDTVKNIENLIGGSAGDTFIGDALANTFSGRAGKDVLDGGAGVDTADYAEKAAAVAVTLNGATVATVTVGGVAEDTVKNIENLIGGSAGDTFTGDALANTFSGRGGKDILDGGAGVDTADYAEKTIAVAVTLNGATVATVTVGGVAEDTVKNIENIIGGSAADKLTGDALANGLSGGGGNDVLKGGGGKDVLDGGAGIDTADYAEKTTAVAVTLNGATAATVTVGGVAEDTVKNIENLIGGSAADTFTGDAFANTFSGRAGKDVLDGGAGVDTADYAEKTTAVAVTLNGATAATVTVGGVAEDTVMNIENIIGGSAGDTLTGDALANGLYGGGGNDLLKGGAGRDVLDGGAGIDTADYAEKTAAVVVTLNGAADATVTVGGVAEDTIRNIENLVGGSGSDRLQGDTLANSLFGGAGNDILVGGGGRDILDGGIGLDTADFSDKLVAVAVTLNGASAATVLVGGLAEDTIINVENLVGGQAGDTLIGDGLATMLNGNAGDDYLDGGLGNDVLTGGLGADRFVFSTSLNALSNLDAISDFNVTDDTIQLSRAIFSALGAGDLQAADFAVGTAATTSAQNIVYDKSSGRLFYDVDGNGAAAQVQFASLAPNLALTAADFKVV